MSDFYLFFAAAFLVFIAGANRSDLRVPAYAAIGLSTFHILVGLWMFGLSPRFDFRLGAIGLLIQTAFFYLCFGLGRAARELFHRLSR